MSKIRLRTCEVLSLLALLALTGCRLIDMTGGGGSRSTERTATPAPVGKPLIGVTPFSTITPMAKAPATVESGGELNAHSQLHPTNLQLTHITINNQPPATYRINDIQIGDIDGDGLPDLWTSGRGGGARAYQMVWYHNPDWTRYPIAPGDYKYGALGDVDDDGDLDVVVGQDWFENTGAPTQPDWPRHPLGLDGDANRTEPDLVHLGDVNRDGQLDIVIFTKHELYFLPASANPKDRWRALLIAQDEQVRTGGALADLDGDGDLDVLWGNAWYENQIESLTDPWPKHTIDESWPSEARGAVGDLDGDGRADVVLSGEESTRGVAWYSAPPDPRANNWLRYDVVTQGYEGVHSLALADFDADGDLDIFAAEMHHGENPDKVSVFENVDIGNNTWIEHILATTGSHNAKVADLNGDGLPDIVGKNYEAGEIPLRIDLWINTTQVLPPSPPLLPVDRWQRHLIDADRPWKAVFIASGDINGDGLPDIITGGWWYRNPGRASGEWTRFAFGGELNNMAIVHDLDGDGDLDVLGTKGKVESAEFVWAENDGTGNFTIHTNLPAADGDFLQGARAAQIIPGGNPEVVVSWHNATSTQIYQIPVPATNDWVWASISSTTNGEQIAIGDVDRDGDLDIHLGTQWLRNEAGLWTTSNTFSLGDPEADPDRVELADIDGDGDLDVVIGAEHALRVVWGEAPADPTALWSEHVISADFAAMSLDVGDLDSDGDPDIVVGEHNRKDPNLGRVLLYLNEGAGRSWRTVEIDTGMEHHIGTRLIDIDNDGDLDILSIGWTHNRVVLYENKAIDR